MKKKLLRPMVHFIALFVWFISTTCYLFADDLKVALAAEPTSMDPHYQNLTINNSFATQIYNALVLQDVNQNLIPGLATSWKPVDDRTWEFTLRKNVKFHNGASFTAEDVIASMEREPMFLTVPLALPLLPKVKSLLLLMTLLFVSQLKNLILLLPMICHEFP